MEVLTDDPELRRETKSYVAFVHEDVVAGLEERIPSWPILKRIVALELCFKKKVLDYIRGNSSTKELDHTRQHSMTLDLEGIKMAEKEIIRSVQRRHFGEELFSLGKGKCLNSCSSIVKLDPFIDDERILRVGRRIKRSAVASEMQHLLLLPKSCRIAELVVHWCHEQVAHAGRGMTVNQIRSSGFWVTRCNFLVRCIILKCVRCKHLRGRLQQQKMANLPK